MKTVPNFEIVVGTYEQYLLGYKLSSKENGFELIQSFATHGHTSSIRCVTSSGKYVASGSADDRIIVYDMTTRSEHVMLNTHNSTVTSIKFTPRNTHLVSASNDGILAIARVGNWQLEKQWDKPHKGAAILDIAVHPTGKLALTLGTDQTLRTWNLIKGRQAYAINLTTKSSDSKSLNCVKWSPCGEFFILSGGMYLEYWSISVGGIVNKYEFESKITSTTWLKDHVAVGHENGTITVLNISDHSRLEFVGHSMRVKCLVSDDLWLVSASSDGQIKLWKWKNMKLIEKGNASTGCRCTCIDLVLNKNVKLENDVKVDEEQSDEVQDEPTINLINKNKRNNRGCKVIVEEEITDKLSKKRKTKKRKLQTE